MEGLPEITLTHHRGLEGLESLRESWNEVVAGMARRRFFHLWEWHCSYLRCLSPKPDAFVFFLFSRGRKPVAIFPLCETSFALGGLRLKALAFPAHGHMLLCDLICQDEAIHVPLFRLLDRYLKKQGTPWDIILLPHLLEDASAIRDIREHPPARFLLRQEGGCDFTITEGTTYESYTAGLSKNFRRSLKRAKQHLDELPAVRFAFTQTGPDLEARLGAFMDVEASGWKGISGTGTAIKLHPELVSFYRELTQAFSASQGTLVNTLDADGRCIAAQYCILLDDTAYMLKVGYDEAYSRYAPGKLLTGRFIQRCMEDPAIKSINYITDADWHADWMPSTYKKSIGYIFSTSPLGLMAYIFMKIYGMHIKPRLPRWLQARIEPKIGADRK